MLEPLAVLQRRVQQRHALSEAAAEAADQLRRQRDLRYQDERAAVQLQRPLHHPQVHLGLAGAGDAVEQEGREGAALERRQQGGHRGGLLVGQRVGAPLLQPLAHALHHGLLLERDEAPRGQPPQHLARPGDGVRH